MKVKITCHSWITTSLAKHLFRLGMAVHGSPVIDPTGDGMDILYVTLAYGWSVKMLTDNLVMRCNIPMAMFYITELS